MRVLLDTNVFLFFAVGSRRLSPRVRSLIEEQEDELIVSTITPWELAIKAAAGRIELPGSAESVYELARAEIRATELPIRAVHALRVGALPRLHGDPFDRMLVAQAAVEGLAIATNDLVMRDYGVDVIW